MTRHLTLIFYIVCSSFQALAQSQHLLDSLHEELKQYNAAKGANPSGYSLADTVATNILNALSAEYGRNDAEQAISYTMQALAIAEKMDYKKDIARSFNNLARAYRNKGDYEIALDYSNKALSIGRSINDKSTLAAAYNITGIILMDQGDYPKALENYIRSLKLREQLGDKKGVSMSYNNIGIIYRNQGKLDSALTSHFSSLAIKNELGDIKGKADSYNNIGIIYKDKGNYTESLKHHFNALKLYEEIQDKKGLSMTYNNIGNIYIEQFNYDEALKNHFASLQMEKELGNKRGIADSHNNIGIILNDQGKYAEALRHHLEALELRKQIGDQNGISMSYNNIGIVYKAEGNYNEALKNYVESLNVPGISEDKSAILRAYINIGQVYGAQKKYRDAYHYLDSALVLAKEQGRIERVKLVYQALSETDSSRGDFKQAFEHYKQFIAARDSLNNSETVKRTVEMQMQYEFDKREVVAKAEQQKKDAIAHKELQKEKLVRNGFIGGFAVVLVFAGIFLRQKNKTKNEQKRSDELLLNILPEEVASELKTTGQAKAKAFTMVTVMFTDFKDFTHISEKVSAELLVNEIHYCFSAFDRIIQNYKIEKIKTIGDSYMCASGLPVSSFTHATDMINAAIEIRDFMLERKKEKEAAGEIPFELRIGIHTGPIVAGIVGIKKYAYDIWGDTVNIAARIEQNSEAGKINISGTTYELIKDKYACVYRGKIDAKNKGMIDMYFVNG